TASISSQTTTGDERTSPETHSDHMPLFDTTTTEPVSTKPVSTKGSSTLFSPRSSSDISTGALTSSVSVTEPSDIWTTDSFTAEGRLSTHDEPEWWTSTSEASTAEKIRATVSEPRTATPFPPNVDSRATFPTTAPSASSRSATTFPVTYSQSGSTRAAFLTATTELPTYWEPAESTAHEQSTRPSGITKWTTPEYFGSTRNELDTTTFPVTEFTTSSGLTANRTKPVETSSTKWDGRMGTTELAIKPQSTELPSFTEEGTYPFPAESSTDPMRWQSSPAATLIQRPLAPTDSFTEAATDLVSSSSASDDTAGLPESTPRPTHSTALWSPVGSTTPAESSGSVSTSLTGVLTPAPSTFNSSLYSSTTHSSIPYPPTPYPTSTQDTPRSTLPVPYHSTDNFSTATAPATAWSSLGTDWSSPETGWSSTDWSSMWWSSGRFSAGDRFTTTAHRTKDRSSESGETATALPTAPTMSSRTASLATPGHTTGAAVPAPSSTPGAASTELLPGWTSVTGTSAPGHASTGAPTEPTVTWSSTSEWEPTATSVQSTRQGATPTDRSASPERTELRTIPRDNPPTSPGWSATSPGWSTTSTGWSTTSTGWSESSAGSSTTSEMDTSPFHTH
ncbi:hypothetical protein GNI_070790, partial [Gregarina niphandrodes]